MSTKKGIIAGVIVLGLFALGGVLYLFFQNGDDTMDIATPQPTPTTTQVSPTEVQREVVQGEVIEDTNTVVDYKNSLLVTLDIDGENTVLYIPSGTVVRTQESFIEREDIRTGDFVRAEVIPIEGGYEALSLEITSERQESTPIPEDNESPITPSPTETQT